MRTHLLLLLASPLVKVFAFTVLSRRQVVHLHYAIQSSDEETEQNDDASSGRFPIDFNQASSRAKNLARKGRDKLKSKAGEGVQSVQNAASGLSNLEQSGRNTVKSAAGAAWSGVNQLATKGSSDVQSAAQFAGSGIIGLAKTASSTAGSAGSSLFGLAQRGTSKATNLVQWMDSQAKDGASVTNAKAQEIVLGFTGKSDYAFGDISKEVLRRASSTDVDIRDVMLLLKVLLTLGATIAPLAKILPVTVLLEMLNVSLETRMGGKILEALAGALDERLLAAFSADELVDVAKRSMTVGIAAFTGKESYKEGDIEQAVKERAPETPEDQSSAMGPTLSPPQPTQKLDLMVSAEFAEWDQAFLEKHQSEDLDTVVEESLASGTRYGRISSEELDKEFVSEMDEWDQKFRAHTEKQQ